MNKNKCLGLAAALLLGVAVSAQASVINLDLTSGTHANLFGSAIADTYTESGFTIQMDRHGDHYDPYYIGDIGFHNGPANHDNISWTLSFGGNAFSLLGVDVAGFASGATSFTITGSNNFSQVLSSTGFSTVSLLNVTSVTFNIDQDGGTQSVGLNGLRVNTTPSVPDTGSSPLLVMMGLATLAYGRKKLA